MPHIILHSQFETSKISLRKLKVVEIASCRLGPSLRRAEWLESTLTGHCRVRRKTQFEQAFD
jgi:hypothetical protein